MFTGKGGGAKDGKGKGAQAKDLLARYGSAYLITSISFAILSFGACYALVSSGAPGCKIPACPLLDTHWEQEGLRRCIALSTGFC